MRNGPDKLLFTRAVPGLGCGVAGAQVQQGGFGPTIRPGHLQVAQNERPIRGERNVQDWGKYVA